jgi:pantoate--beta-alanine ligase
MTNSPIHGWLPAYSQTKEFWAMTQTPLATCRTPAALRAQVLEWQQTGHRVALVPTMGALHAGHLSLITKAVAHADRVVASIFVNPTQFGPKEDLSRYPRQEAQDAKLLKEAGCHGLFLPSVSDMYPDGFATTVSVSGLTDILCGAVRPGHFDGVATVVAKLLNMAGADVAVFGEKDFQQLHVIRRMATDLNIATHIIGAPLLRDADGLALSSRNAYLSAAERAQALALPRGLMAARDMIRSGGDIHAALAMLHDALRVAGFVTVDYAELRDEDSLAPVTKLDRPARLLAAARIGTTRLIDNMSV